MKHCQKCGYSLSIEKFCPQCGIKLEQNKVKNDRNNITISDNSSDLIDTRIKSGENNIDKKIDYRVEGDAIHLQVLDDRSNPVLKELQKLMSISIQLEPPSSLGNKLEETYRVKSEESNTAYQRIQIILKESKKRAKETGIEIKDINVGDVKVSKNELILKEIILNGNEYYYKNEPVGAIEQYDKALEIEPKYALAMYNKGSALGNMGKYHEAIECYDKALEIDPNNVKTLNNKRLAMTNQEKS
jgi:tetratricopeptide (TPR) repeat protein